MEYLIENMIVEWLEPEDDYRLVRVLKVLKAEGLVCVYDLLGKNANPHWIPFENVYDDILSGDAQILRHDHITDKELRSDDQLTDKELAIRNERYAILKPLLEAGEGKAILDDESRRELFEDFRKQDREKYMRWLRDWWRLGQTINSLAPNHQSRGGKDQMRLAPADPTKQPKNVGQSSANDEENTTYVITERDYKIMMAAYKKYYMSGEFNLKGAYDRMIRTRYIDGYTVDADGYRIPVQKPKGQRPEFHQFKHYCHKNRDREKVISGRQGKTYFDANKSPKKGSSRSLAIHPGYFLGVDSTILAMLLVSMLCRAWVVGKPTLYLVFDQFSSMIVGYNLDFSSSSWLSQAMAIVHTATDKVSWCKKYGYTIQHHEWPAAYIGDFYFGDRGEMESINAGNFLNYLNSGVVNTPPRRPDLKGFVEMGFHLLGIMCLIFFPGETPSPKTREKVLAFIKKGKFPVITINELHEAICRWIVFYNNHHVLKEYVPVHSGIIQDNVDFTPIALWNWGIDNLGASLRYVPSEQVYRALLPREKATITYQGIKFRDLYYELAFDQDEAFEREMLIKARDGRSEITVSYDPRTTDYIFWHFENEAPKSCLLVEKCEVFRSLNWVEVEKYSSYRGEMISRLDDEYRLHYNEYATVLESIAENAKKEAEAVREELGIKKSNVLKGIRRNTIIEQVRVDHEFAFETLMDQLKFEQEQQPLSSSVDPKLLVPKPDYAKAVFSALEDAFGEDLGQESNDKEDENES